MDIGVGGVAKHLPSIHPVTALEFLPVGDAILLLAGDGPYLKVFWDKAASCAGTVRIFPSQIVHGVARLGNGAGTQSTKRICVWGGWSLCLVELTFSNDASGSNPVVKSQVCSTLWAPDWVLDFHGHGSWEDHPTGAGSACLGTLLTAHNVLFLLRRENGHHISLVRLGSCCKSILYSAHVFWLSEERILVAAGTVYGEILVWTCLLGDGAEKSLEIKAYCKLHFVFRGHEGSVFGVQISPDLSSTGPDGPTRLLASCSDDRTLRVWDISSWSSTHGPPLQRDTQEVKHEYQKTGFSSSEQEVLEKETDMQPLAIGWGHASRIWQVKFMQPSLSDARHPSTVRLMTFGEDATAQIWHLRGETNPGKPPGQATKYTWSLIHGARISQHTGKNIWSAALHEGASSILATGGADGRIFKSSIDCIVSQFDAHKASSWTVANILSRLDHRYDDGVTRGFRPLVGNSTVPQGDSSGCNLQHQEIQRSGSSPVLPLAHIAQSRDFDTFKSYSFVNGQQLLAITNHGYVLLGAIESLIKERSDSMRTKVVLPFATQSSWKLVAHRSDLQTYSLIVTPSYSRVSFIGTKTGLIYYYCHASRSISTLTQTVGKVASLHVQSAQGEYLLILLRAETPIFNTPKDDIILLAASLHTAEVSCFFVDEPALHRRGSTSETVKTVRLQLPSNFVVTSMYFARGPRRIFMGSRKGAVAIYDLSSAVATPESIAIEAMTCFRRIHGEDAVSAIVGIPNSQQAALANSQIVTVGRNGTYAVHQVHWDDPSASTTRLNTVHVSSPSIKLMITGSFYDVANNLIFYGFHNTDFIVWDETSQKVLMNVSCGGAHRSWDYYAIHGEYGKGAFVWTQAALMHLRVQDGNAFTTLQSGGHGREIKAVAISPRLSDHSGNTRIVATGAEDTDIRLFSVERHGDGGSQQSGTKCLRILKKHTTGIQHLQWSNSGDFLFSSGGFEEFYVWRVTFVPGFGIGTLLEASCPVRSESPDLRIMSFDVLALSKGDTPKSGLPSEGFLISMVLSDSNIRVYQYSPENKTFETLFRGTYGSCCLTEASHFRIDNSLHSCVGGTDGHLAIYEYEKAGMAPKDYLQSITSTIDRPRNLPLLQRFAVHQSTVKCLTIASLASGEALVVSGGDDSAIAFTRLKFNGPDTQLSHSTLLVPRAHASAVTALTQLPVFNFFGREGENESYSVFLFATSSNDQRLKIWSLRINLTKPGVSEFQPLLALDISTSIADCSSLATFRESQNAATVKVIVCGVGMDVWEIDCGHLVP